MGSGGRGNPSRCQRLPLAAALRSSGNNRLFRGHGPAAICDAFGRETGNRHPWLFAHPRIFCGANAATAASVPRTCAGPLHLVWEDVIEPPATPSTPFLDFLPKSHLLRFIVYASGGEQDVMEKVRVFDGLSLSSDWPVGPVCRRLAEGSQGSNRSDTLESRQSFAGVGMILCLTVVVFLGEARSENGAEPPYSKTLREDWECRAGLGRGWFGSTTQNGKRPGGWRRCAGPLHLVWEDVIEPPATPSTPFLDFLPKSHLLRFIVYTSGGEQDVMEKCAYSMD